MGGRAVLILAVGALVGASSALGGPVPVTGGVYTSVNAAVDGTNKCLNGNPAVNCNLYAGKPYVWLNGGPAANGLGPDGKYFFAVLAPGGQPNPNDGGAGNLSDNFDAYTNRTFTVTNGEVSAYTGTHDFDSGAGTGPRAPNHSPPLIRLFPYANTSNPGDVYIMAVCSIGADGLSYPVNPSACKYDAFKARFADSTPPVCVLTATGTNQAGAKYIQVTVQDPYGASDSGSGIESIEIDDVRNATLTYSPDPWYVGTMQPIIITATKTVATKSSFLKLTVTNVAGLSTTCDPEVPAVRAKAKRTIENPAARPWVAVPWRPNRLGGV